MFSKLKNLIKRISTIGLATITMVTSINLNGLNMVNTFAAEAYTAEITLYGYRSVSASGYENGEYVGNPNNTFPHSYDSVPFSFETSKDGDNDGAGVGCNFYLPVKSYVTIKYDFTTNVNICSSWQYIDGVRLTKYTNAINNEVMEAGTHRWGIALNNDKSSKQTTKVNSITITATAVPGNTCKDNGHTWSEWSNKSATCTEDGYHNRTCDICDATENNTYNALGHNYNSNVTFTWKNTTNACNGVVPTVTTSSSCTRLGCSQKATTVTVGKTQITNGYKYTATLKGSDGKGGTTTIASATQNYSHSYAN